MVPCFNVWVSAHLLLPFTINILLMRLENFQYSSFFKKMRKHAKIDGLMEQNHSLSITVAGLKVCKCKCKSVEVAELELESLVMCFGWLWSPSTFPGSP